MKKESPQEDLKGMALRMLGRRDLSEAELKTKLEKKGFQVTSINEVLTDLKKMGYIDDRSLCERLARYLAEDRQLGNRRIEATLLNKGFSPTLVRETLERIRTDLPEEEALRMYLAKEGKRRITAGKLIYRGFPPGLVYELLHGRGNNEGR